MFSLTHKWLWMLILCLWISKNNRSFDTPVKGPPQGPRLHIDIPRVQLLIEDKEGIKQIGERKSQKKFLVCLHVSTLDCSIKCELKRKPVFVWRWRQGYYPGDRHRVQPNWESSELLHWCICPSPCPHPKHRSFDRHVWHQTRNQYVFSLITVHSTSVAQKALLHML